jgi:hypothetical protein
MSILGIDDGLVLSLQLIKSNNAENVIVKNVLPWLIHWPLLKEYWFSGFGSEVNSDIPEYK